MSTNENKTSVAIEAEVTGIDKVDSLGKSIEGLGQITDEAAQEELRHAEIIEASKNRQKMAAQEVLEAERKAALESQQIVAMAAAKKQEAMKAQMAEEDRQAAIVEASVNRQKMAAQELLAAEKLAYAEAEAASARAAAARELEAKAVEAFASRTKNALDNAFSTVGVRSTTAIEADILEVNQALMKLAANAKVSGADFDRAFAAGQARIAVLRAEMDSTGAASSKLAATTKTLAGEFNGLVAQLGGAFLAFQAGSMFVSANAQAESLTRTMTLLTGSSERAAAEMAYVRDAASRLGIEVGDASKSYAQLTAATKGTAMEGAGAREVFEAVSGAMASLGKSSAETNDALRAVNQMASKGTVQMEELKGQLGEALPGAMKAAANGAGLTVAELTKMIENGSVLAEDLLPALSKGLREMYGVGTAANETFSANMARLKNSFNDMLITVGSTGTFKALSEGLAVAAKGVAELTVGFVAAGQKIGIMAAAIANGDLSIRGWSDRAKQALGEVDAQTQQTLQKIDETGQATAKALAKSGEAAAAAGKQATESSGSWLKVANAYTQVEEASKKQIDNLKTLQAARDSEGTSLKAYADTYGTQVEKLDAATAAAKSHEAALRALDVQVQADLEISKSKLDSLEAERRLDGTLTESKEKLRETLQKTIESKQAEADKTTQATAAAHSATLQAEAATTVYGDHAKQVYALRDAWHAAETEYQRLSALNAQGVSVSTELKAADEARAKALLLYRDALADATAAAERHVTAERTASNLTEASLQNDKLRAETILEVARQRGNEKDIAEAQIAVWRIELQINEAQAEAARKEAEAILLVAKARRAELEASDALTPAKRAELDVMEASAKAKQFEAEKYDLLADRMRKLAYETRGLESSFGDLSSSADQAAASADRAASSYDGLASSIRSAGQAKDGFVRNTNGEIVTTGPDVRDLAVRNTQTPEQARFFEEDYNYFYRKASQDPANYSSMQGLQYGAIERQATEAAAAEAQRRAAASNQSNGGSQANGFQYGNAGRAVTVNINTGSGRSTQLHLADQASADALVRLLQTQLAARS
ncbi:tape measure protein [Zoogloea sp.]|uniref:tape measure protein n=1 Tax=Zoogloea sp. TaxID=49181 RepID=UPI0035AF4719